MASSSGSSGPLIFAPPPSPPPTPLTPEATLSTQERLRLAKKRRAAQLKRWHQRERGGHALGENMHSERPDLLEHTLPHHELGKGVIFVPSVMLLEAASRNDVEEVRRLLEMGVSPDSTNEDGLTALHQCCIDDSEEMMKVLLDYGGNPNATDTEKWTPLHAAATCGHLHLVKFLIDHGAYLLAVNADGNMPYDLCEDETTLSYIENEMAKRGVTQELIDETRGEIERRMLHDLQMAGEDWLEVPDASGATPLHVAAANGYLQVVEYLLDHHVSTEVVDLDQWQPIHAAACWGHLEVVELLAQNGANIMAKSKSGETPFDICEDPDIKERLIQLKEQRVRLEQPKVRRTRSTSTRTQSIRRTSLREKMNTTKRDVQDEKFFLMKTLDVMPLKKDDGSKSKESNAPLDVKDVELTIRSGYSPTEEVPTRPPRPNRDGSSSSPMPSPSRGHPNSHSSSSKGPSYSQQRSMTSSDTSNTIHVSGGMLMMSNSSPSKMMMPPSESHSPSISSYNLGTPSSSAQSPAAHQTLAELKKARSQTRITSPTSAPSSASSGPPSATAINQSLSSGTLGKPPVLPEKPASKHAHGSNQNPPRSPPRSARDSAQHRNSQKNARQRSVQGGQEGVSKYSSDDPGEVVGGTPVKKHGCCTIL